jgi:hypothetical protein
MVEFVQHWLNEQIQTLFEMGIMNVPREMATVYRGARKYIEKYIILFEKQN